MVAITGDDTFFTNVDSSFTATKWEACIDQAIDKVNGYAGETLISNMTGDAGSKTVTVTSAQAGFIRELAVAIYQKDVKSAGAQSSSYGMGAISRSQSASSSSGAAIEELAKEAAARLSGRGFSRV
jgi:hypothetical protein